MSNHSKVRILSFQNAQNYGAVLQAYGLQQALKGLGYEDVAFINYNPKYLRNRYLVFPKRWYAPHKRGLHFAISYYINLPFTTINRWKRNKRINQSRSKLLRQTKEQYLCLSDIDNVSCNYLVCGSDQIWSTWITGEPDPVFFGEGGYVGMHKRIAYAPSTELSSFNSPNHVKTIKKLIENFDHISVREESVRNVLFELTNKDISVCIDPTLLCGTEAFSLIAAPPIVKHKYILVYAYETSDVLIQAILKSIPSFEDYEVQYLTFSPSAFRASMKSNYHGEASIEQFVSLFKYASYVVTNSFHGLAFSLLFEKPFLVSYVDGKSTRTESLLKQLQLENLLIKDETQIKWELIDYDVVNNKLDSMRKESLSFLSNSLQ